MSDPSVINNPQGEQNSANASAGEGVPLAGTPTESTRPWIRFYERGVPAELSIPDRPLTWLLDQAVSRYPGQIAIIYYGTKLSYAQLSSLANRFATGLQ